ncbi:hypothetical protein EDD36DRAFT_419015 [Exophiala viscosa]|uniref:Secreted protein n=1 Tax=Exophiala viscosa TaxID=2486360 RepID=A0AAN6DWQ2_9EURO|nr:hypothetical protein EDD36DRAFT_419015 [Exophiala viscosa]
MPMASPCSGPGCLLGVFWVSSGCLLGVTYDQALAGSAADRVDVSLVAWLGCVDILRHVTLSGDTWSLNGLVLNKKGIQPGLNPAAAACKSVETVLGCAICTKIDHKEHRLTQACGSKFRRVA